MSRKSRRKKGWWHRFIFHHAKNQFIPHKGNGHVPHLLHHHKLFGLSLLFVLLKAAVIAAPAVLPAGTLYSSAITPSNIVELTNATRLASGLEELTQNEVLAQAAVLKARDMLANQYFAHTSPAGISPIVWVDKVGYTYQVVGENLAVHFAQAEDVQSGWMASPSHRANILDGRFKDIGVGVAQGEYGGHDTIMVVQMFGSPRGPASLSGGVVGTDEVSAMDDQPKIDVSSVKVTPSDGGYDIGVQVEDATSVSVLAGEESAVLTKSAANFWTGSIRITANAAATDLVIATSRDFQEEVIQPIASVAPGAEVKGFFHFARDTKESAIRGVVSADSLNDFVGRLYFYALLLLGALLVLTALVKHEVQHHTILAHGLLVMILGVVLVLI